MFFEFQIYLYTAARKLQSRKKVLTGFSVGGVKIDSPYAKHNWTPF
jgi:hypothetical protein